MEQTNTAKRLHDLILKLNKVTDGKFSGTSSSQIFLDTIGEKKSTPIDFAQEFLIVLTAIEDLRKIINLMNSQSRSNYFDVVKWLITIFSSISLQTQWGNVRSNFDPNNQNAKLLLALNDVLNEKIGEIELEQGELGTIRNAIAEAMADVRQADIEDEGKAAILEFLNRLMVGLDNYQFRGLEALKESLQSSLGVYGFKKAVFQKAFEKVEKTQKVVEIFVKLYAAYEKCSPKLVRLAQSAHQLLGLPS